MNTYQIPKCSGRAEYVVKKSRFIAQLHRVENRAQAMALLTTARQEYPDARHHCWAYQIGDPNSPSLAAMSDDGEPGGTAGKPILNVIQHKDVGDVMVIVIRYFGGIKLGAGGLVRAYSAAAQQVFDESEFIEHRELESLIIRCEFGDEQRFRHEAERLGGTVSHVKYNNVVTLDLLIEKTRVEELKRIVDGINNAELIDDVFN